ncbi:hypothetical protein [Tunicatimonas pelagia]|uniref:hypothetical protein n=1 Tax=Tunicatimonas pelagia TaxID=931531 RepID=UPI0026659D55|nr:hypothetical protein [Tunicatimonas pelagia]WKN41889.1 hypothetical protein P0M28_22880 [Tunicatimonas pelagia]
MKLCYLLTNVLLFLNHLAWSQTNTSVWKELTDVVIEDRYDASVGYEISYPVFGDRATALDGQQVTVKGYMIPFEAYLKPNYFILSALPIAACFFCGGAGPETVMEVFSQDNIELSSEVIELRGTLELNADNPDRMMYILHDAELIEN